MQATSKNVVFPGHNHLLYIYITAGTDGPSLIYQPRSCSGDKVSGHQCQWLAGGYDLEIGHFNKWLVWWLPGAWWL